SRSLISGQQKSSIIMFGNLEDPQNETPVIDNVVLHGNYPNPFNPETKISFSLPQDQEIELTVYNLKGQKVRTLYTGITSSGEQSLVWNGKDDDGKSVGSGLYFYKLRTENKVYSKKMLLLK
ncbi:MAG: T9SS type A sorting domain-containing protein, partial [Armatimonadetes bacterium]|nr:T9SS type A sorting domain-containing protein [Armatimonadota bacterium]